MAATVLGSAAAMAQTPRSPLPANPEEELSAARESNRRTGEVLAKFNIPMALEPAFVFKA